VRGGAYGGRRRVGVRRDDSGSMPRQGGFPEIRRNARARGQVKTSLDSRSGLKNLTKSEGRPKKSNRHEKAAGATFKAIIEERKAARDYRIDSRGVLRTMLCYARITVGNGKDERGTRKRPHARKTACVGRLILKLHVRTHSRQEKELAEHQGFRNGCASSAQPMTGC